MSREQEAVDLLRSIVRAYTEGDVDGLEALMSQAGEWLAGGPEPEGEPTVQHVEAPPINTTSAQPVPSGSAAQAFVRLYNAAKRLVDQGPTPSTMAEITAAVANASRFV